jgi:hypothetical protein
VIAVTVPSPGAAIHNLPLPSNTPPVMPGGNRSGSPTGPSVRGSICCTCPCTVSTTNAASSSSATRTPMPGLEVWFQYSCKVVRSSVPIAPVLTSRRITNRSVWLTSSRCPRALATLTRVSTLAVTPLMRATSPLPRLHTQEAASKLATAWSAEPSPSTVSPSPPRRLRTVPMVTR